MLLYFTAVSAIVPSILLLWWFRSRDLRPEPLGALLSTFALGVATVFPVLLFALPVSAVLDGLAIGAFRRGCVNAFVTAAGPEEFFKFLVVALYAARHREFDEPMDGVVYGAVASLGFASLENILYVSDGGIGVAVMRAVTAVPGHAFTGALMGYWVGQAKFDPARRASHLAKAYFVPFVLHGLYDAPLLALNELSKVNGGHGAGDGAETWLVLTPLVLVVEAMVTRRITTRLRAEQIRHAARLAATVGGPLAASPVAKPAGGAGLGAVLLVVGVLLASGGGLVSLALAIALAVDGTGSNDPGATLVGGAVLGLLPLVVGLVAFRAGIRRLSRANLASATAPAAPVYGAYAPPQPPQYPPGAPRPPWQQP